MPFKSEKQRRYLWANEPEIARDWTDTYGSRIKKNDGGVMSVQGGVKNYLGDQKTVSGVPVKWKSRPGKPETELAYITKAEKDLILKKDLHGSLSKGPNVGPGGVMSLDSWGDIGGGGQSGADYDADPGGAGTFSGQGPTQTTTQHQMQKENQREILRKAEQRQAERLGYDAKKEERRSAKLRKKAKAKKFSLKDQLKSRLDTGYNWSMMLPGQRKRSLGYAQNYLDYYVDKGGNIEGLEDVLDMDPKDWSAEQFNKVMSLSSQPAGYRGQEEIIDYPDYLAEYKGAPGMKYSGNVGNLEKFKKDDGTYGYKEITGGEGPIYYPGYVPGGSPVSGGGGGGTTAATTTTPSAFQQSLTTGASSPFDYHVGQDPTAANLAWGEKFNVDPRTMYRTSWADGGRIGRAYGGIMDTETGRRAYGFGSIFSKIGKAAKKVFKSPIGKAALLAGAGWAANTWGPTAGWWGSKGKLKALAGKHDWLGKMLLNKEGNYSLGKLGIMGAGALPLLGFGQPDEDEDEGFDYAGAKNKYMDELMRIKAGAMAGSLDTNKFRYLGVKDGGRIGMYAGGQSTPSDYTMEDAMMTTTQDKLGGITDVMKQADLNRQGSVGQFYAAHGGSADDNNARLEARVKELQDEGLDYNSAMAQAMKELSSGKAQGGRIGYAGGSGSPPITLGQNIQAPGRTPPPPPRPHPMPAPQPNRMAGMPGGMNPMMNRPMMNPMMGGMHPMMNRPMMNPMGGRRMAQEGGLMDLGGMEKDYRNDGGFVPLGGEEKADDVPARLSKNEFVFTADAVRGAGDGDIDKGAEIMENIMKNLEQGGQISEETQGLSGAQEMFGVSERLGEVL